ncbi:transglycosylase SLT domain-containing protein [Vibrio chagasii]|nr:transglycosylase SLT domain-containing protein [Vibrio chagasii]
MLESSYNANAVSPAKAAGLWQLMPATAERFGLTVNDGALIKVLRLNPALMRRCGISIFVSASLIR